MKKVQISLDYLWVAENTQKDFAVANELEKIVMQKLTERNINFKFPDLLRLDCEVIIIDDIDDLALQVLMRDALKDLLKDEKIIDDVAKIDITELAEENDKLDKCLKEIDSMVGAEEFKKLINECVLMARSVPTYLSTKDIFIRQCYLFSINDGCGLSKSLRLFAETLFELGLLEPKDEKFVVEINDVPPPQAGAPSPFSMVQRAILDNKESARRIIMVDIKEWMTHTNDKRFRELLTFIEDNLTDKIVVFRVPFVEKDILNGIKKSIGDILSVREVSFVPFDNEELIKYAKIFVTKYGFKVDDDVWDVVLDRINEEKNDGLFYGINTVEKIIREMIYKKILHDSKKRFLNMLIKKEEVYDLAASHAEKEKTGAEMLEELIGVENIKKRIDEIVAQIEMAAQNPKLGAPCIHMRFLGNPGTGKTTVARIIGKILKEKGILRNGKFFECSGRDLCGEYIGHTAPKTAAKCRDAYGSVLFIDEAYSLYRGAASSERDFGREAIDTLIAEMENHRSDLVVIMAGYTDDMNELMKGNIGLASRMPYVIEFPNYTRQQLFEIFMLMVNKTIKYEVGFDDVVKEYFDTLSEDVITAKEFSNARFVRNLFERTCGKAALRVQLNKDDPNLLIKEDFLAASSEAEFAKMMQKKNPRIGFI